MLLEGTEDLALGRQGFKSPISPGSATPSYMILEKITPNSVSSSAKWGESKYLPHGLREIEGVNVGKALNQGLAQSRLDK